MHFTNSFSDGMLELHWGNSDNLCHKHTLTTADAMCKTKRKYLLHVVQAIPLTSYHLNLSDFSYDNALKRKFKIWKYKTWWSIILVLAAGIRGQSGQVVCVRESSECYCDARKLEVTNLSRLCEEMHNSMQVPLCHQRFVFKFKLKRGSNCRIIVFFFAVIETNKWKGWMWVGACTHEWTVFS
jgi:hypothetical protein